MIALFSKTPQKIQQLAYPSQCHNEDNSNVIYAHMQLSDPLRIMCGRTQWTDLFGQRLRTINFCS